MIHELTKKVISGGQICMEEALSLIHADLNTLCLCADKIRRHFCQNTFDMCSIINAKSGLCSEDCHYCAQSARYNCQIEHYPLLAPEVIMNAAVKNYENGILRFSVVTSGRQLSDIEINEICSTYKKIRKSCPIELCASMGLLTKDQFIRLKAAGVTRYHNNLETSRRYFPKICTTHTYDDKIEAIKNAQAAGLDVCSGGIMGLGETMRDRIDMAFTLRELNIRSVPINILNPIPGTPLGNRPVLDENEVRRITAIYRFILPESILRLAGGRSLIQDNGRAVFLSGANGAITQNMLTTAGAPAEEDKKLIHKLGFEVKKYE